jgi:hypothetical protein
MCYKCLKSFTDKDAFHNHNCDDNGEDKIKKKMEQKNEGKMLTDLAHYLTSSFTKGSQEEIAELIAKLENPNREKEDKIKKIKY